MAYERVLLQGASKKTKQKLVDAANRLLPTFVKHALWRPKERAFIGEMMRSRDIEKLKEDIEIGVRLAQSLGLDVSDVQLPIPYGDVDGGRAARRADPRPGCPGRAGARRDRARDRAGRRG